MELIATFGVATLPGVQAVFNAASFGAAMAAQANGQANGGA
jgi:hypothetical protein